MKYFRIRLGSENAQFEDGFKRGYIGVDYDVNEDLNSLLAREGDAYNAIKEAYRRHNPSKSERSAGQCAGNIWCCIRNVQIGDTVLTTDTEGNVYYGIVTGDYEWKEGQELQHQRPITWSRSIIDKEKISQSLFNSIVSRKTCIEIDENTEELKALIRQVESTRNQWIENVPLFIHRYAERFGDIAPQELYKWEAIHHFQQHWDLEAKDFRFMLSAALSKTENLLTARFYLPKAMILDFAEAEPETVRTALRWLLDEEGLLEQRLKDFKAYCSALKNQHNPEAKQHFQQARAASVYLTLRHPDRYAFYMPNVFENAAQLLEYPDPPKHGDIGNFRRWMDMIHAMASLLELPENANLVEAHKARLNENCYQGDGLILLAQDIAFSMKYHMD